MMEKECMVCHQIKEHAGRGMCNRCYQKWYLATHPEQYQKLLHRLHVSRKENPEAYRQKEREKRAKDPEKYRESQRRWRATHPDYYTAENRKKRKEMKQ